MSACTEATILKALFPPSGAIPLERIDALPQIRSHIRSAIGLADGSQPTSMARTCNPILSQELTQKVVELKESPEGADLCWREIGAKIGITEDAAAKRYQKFIKAREAEELRKEGDETLRNVPCTPGTESSDHIVGADEMIAAAAPDGKKNELDEVLAGPSLQETQSEHTEKAEPQEKPQAKKVETRGGRKNPKIPHTEDDFILGRRSQGTRFSTILAELRQKGIECNVDDVTARYYTAASKKALEAKGKKPHNAPTPKEVGKQDASEPATEASAVNDEKCISAEENVAEVRQEEKPAAKAISRADLDRKIWDAWKAGKTPEQISDDLYAEGLYYSEKSVRIRLISQGADL